MSFKKRHRNVSRFIYLFILLHARIQSRGERILHGVSTLGQGKPSLWWKVWISPFLGWSRWFWSRGGKVHDHFLTKSVSLLHLPFLPSTSACLPPPSSGTWSSFNLLHLSTSQTPAQMVFPKINHGFLSADQQLIKRRLIKVAAASRLFSPLVFSSARRVTILPSSSHAKPS